MEVWTESEIWTLANEVVFSQSAIQGVVRVHLLAAEDLLAKDTYMMGLVKGKSDPYATIRVGNKTCKSKVIKENLNPVWNEVYEVELRSRTLQRQSFIEASSSSSVISIKLSLSSTSSIWFSHRVMKELSLSYLW